MTNQISSKNNNFIDFQTRLSYYLLSFINILQDKKKQEISLLQKIIFIYQGNKKFCIQYNQGMSEVLFVVNSIHKSLFVHVKFKTMSVFLLHLMKVRCEAIVNSLVYVFTLFLKKGLLCHTCPYASLKQIVQTKAMKCKGMNTNHAYEKFPQTILQHKFNNHKKYLNNQENIIFAHLPKQKFKLKKVFFKQKLKECDEYKMYVCKIESTVSICKIYNKECFDMEKFNNHKNIPQIQNILFVVSFQNKIFVFFAFIEQILRINQLYLKKSVINILQHIQLFQRINIKYPQITKNSFLFTKQGVIWKEFRYSKKQQTQDQILCIAPEKLVNDSTTFESNIYAIGIFLYEIIFSKKPFDHEEQDILIYLKLNCQITFPKYFTFQPSVELRQFISICIKVNPQNRFRNIQQVKASHWFLKS